MKAFKAPNWDSDVEGSQTCELLTGSLNRKKFLASDEKKKLKKLIKKQFHNSESNDVKFITVQTKIELSKSQKHKDSAPVDSPEFSEQGKKFRKKCKKSKTKTASDSEDSKDVVMKKQKRILKKHSDQLGSSSDKLVKELLREKKRQKKLRRKLEKTAKKMDKSLATKLNKNVEQKHIKKESIDCPSKYNIEVDEKVKKKHKKDKVCSDVRISPLKVIKEIKFQNKLKNILDRVEKLETKPIMSLRQKMMEKLKAARFRFLNEQIYTTDSREAQKIFKSDPEAFIAYHEGYRQQVKSWPVNPLDVIIKSIKKMPKTHIVADFGCGDAKLAKSVHQEVHSFDLVAVNDTVVACDMAKVPLADSSVHVVVFCLSLMGTNLQEYLLEANRVLKINGILKIAEVESRFEDVDNFIAGVQHFGFKNMWKDLSHNLFYYMDFKKIMNIKNKKKTPTISLLPCLYKKR